MIISVLNIKGGVGKTTLTTNLAVGIAMTGKSVLLIDTDKQGSSLAWRGARSDEKVDITVISITRADALKKQIIGFRKAYDCVIVDGSPHVDALAAVSIAGSDLILLPVGPSAYDIWATQKMAHQITSAQEINPNIYAAFVINKFKSNTLSSKETVEVLEALEIPLLPKVLGQRVAYTDTVTQGLSALEWNDPKAKHEVQDLVNEILEMADWPLLEL